MSRLMHDDRCNIAGSYILPTQVAGVELARSKRDVVAACVATGLDPHPHTFQIATKAVVPVRVIGANDPEGGFDTSQQRIAVLLRDCADPESVNQAHVRKAQKDACNDPWAGLDVSWRHSCIRERPNLQLYRQLRSNP